MHRTIQSNARAHSFAAGVLGWVLAAAFLPALNAWPDDTTQRTTLVMNLQQRLGLTERQVRGALGALLVLAQEKLPKSDFDDLARRVPNAQRTMDDVKLQGIVTRPLDGVEDFEAALSSLGIGQPLASQFAPAVLDYLGAAGYDQERDLLASVLN